MLAAPHAWQPPRRSARGAKVASGMVLRGTETLVSKTYDHLHFFAMAVSLGLLSFVVLRCLSRISK